MINWQINSNLSLTIYPQDYSVGAITPINQTGLSYIKVELLDIDNALVGAITTSVSGPVGTVSLSASGVISINLVPASPIENGSVYTLIVNAVYQNNTIPLYRTSIQTYT